METTSTSATSHPHDTTAPGWAPQAPPQPSLHQLRRPAHGRMVAGVAASLARYLDVDTALVRIALVVLTIAGGAGLPLYLAGWLLIPQEGTDVSIAADLLSGQYFSR